MPYKDPEIRRIKGAEYQRNFRENMSLEEKEIYKQKDNAQYKDWYSSLSAEEKKEYSDKHNAQLREQYATNPAIRLRIKEEAFTQYRQKREAVIVHLGGRCASPDCAWLNVDIYGQLTRGCTDSRCLQIDHVLGDGAKRRRTDSSERGTVWYRKVLKSVPGEEYQLLCANCNWIKRCVNGETPKSRFATAGS